MNKKLTTVVCCLMLANAAFAQKTKRRLQFFAEAGALFHINAGDIKGNKNLIRQEDGLGSTMGIGMRLTAPRNMQLLVGMGMRFSPQKLVFADGIRLKEDRHLDGHYYLRFLLAYAVPAGTGSKLDIGVGFQNIYSVRNKNNGPQMFSLEDGAGASYLSSSYNVNWGDRRKTEERLLVPFVFCPTLRLGWQSTGIWKGRSLGIFLEFSTKAGSNAGRQSSNEGYLYQLDKDRNVTDKASYRDQYTALTIGLTLGL